MLKAPTSDSAYLVKVGMASGSMEFFRARRYIWTSDSTRVLSGPFRISCLACTTAWAGAQGRGSVSALCLNVFLVSFRGRSPVSCSLLSDTACGPGHP